MPPDENVAASDEAEQEQEQRQQKVSEIISSPKMQIPDSSSFDAEAQFSFFRCFDDRMYLCCTLVSHLSLSLSFLFSCQVASHDDRSSNHS